MVKICIDAGHGGYDPGACGNGRQEKDYTLRLALGLGEKLQQQGVNIIYTRTDDRFLELSERANISTINNCDYFLSQHVNSGGGYGVETFAYPTSNKGKDFAQAIQSSMVTNGLVTRDRGVKTANFAVLRGTKCPSILIENHFIDNSADMEFLDANLNKIIEVQAKAVLDFIGVGYKEEQPSPAPTPTPPAPPRHPQTWELNISGQIIKDLQYQLNIQYGAGLSVDGYAGDSTMAKLVTVRPGARGEITRIIQKLLIMKGYNVAYGADGAYGNGTTEAVRSIQRNNGLSADGITGKNTWRVLLRK